MSVTILFIVNTLVQSVVKLISTKINFLTFNLNYFFPQDLKAALGGYIYLDDTSVQPLKHTSESHG